MERIGEIEALDARDSLNRIHAAGFLNASPKLEAFLRYVVIEELEGRGDGINAYAIAVNALNRPSSFDPQSDPVVRVFAGRLRSALADYYDGPGKSDPVRVAIPKGSYRPQFSRAPDAPAVPQEPLPREQASLAKTARPAFVVPALLALILVAAGAISYSFLLRGGDQTVSIDEPAETADTEITFPIVEIGPFSGGADPSMQGLLEGIRQQLALDLAQFRTLRVRDMPVIEGGERSPKQSDFRVIGNFMKSGSADMLEIAVQESASGSILWKETLNIPRNDAEYQDLLLTAVRAIAPRLAGISGIVQNDAIQRLEKRRDELGNTKTSEYECIVKFYVFGQRRSPESEMAARQCLQDITSQGSRDSMVWAFWALTKYFDWSRNAGGDAEAEAYLAQSLDAAHKAIELDPANANAHEFAAMAYSAMGETETARESFERALTLNPSKADFYVHYGTYFIRLGEWERGVELVQQGIDLSPSPPGWMYMPLAVDAFRRDDFEDSLQIAKKIIASGDRRGYLPALAAAIALGDKDETNRCLAGYRKAYGTDVEHPLAELARVYPDEELIGKYERMLASVLTQ